MARASEELLCPKRRPSEHICRFPYGALECLGQCSLNGRTIRQTLLNVLHLVHTKKSNVLITYFYVPKNTYRNIRILKILPIPILLFLLKIAVACYSDGHRPVNTSFSYQFVSFFYSFYSKPFSHHHTTTSQSCPTASQQRYLPDKFRAQQRNQRASEYLLQLNKINKMQ